MIFRKALTYVAAAIIMATAAGVFVVALAFALFALTRDYLGAPGAAAVVAVAAAILVAIIGLIMSQKAHTKTAKYMKQDDVPLTTRLIDLAKERPVVAGVAALAATVFVARNPKMMTGLLSAVLAARAAKSAPPPVSKKR